MKTRTSIIALFLLLFSLGSYAQKSGLSDIFFYEQLSKKKEISTITISKAMIEAFPDALEVLALDVKSLADKLDQVEIYRTEREEYALTMKEVLRNYFLRRTNYETIMSMTRKDKSSTAIHAEMDKDKIITSLVMVVEGESKSHYILVRLKGRFQMKDIQGIIRNLM
jgi:hypothetical protein